MTDCINAATLARTVPQDVEGARVLASAGQQLLELATVGRNVDPERGALARLYLDAANIVAQEVNHWVDDEGRIYQQGRR